MGSEMCIRDRSSSSASSSEAIGVHVLLGQLLAVAILAEAANPATAGCWRRRGVYDEMIGPDLRSTAFQVLSALTAPENRTARGNRPQLLRLSTSSGHRPLQPQAFHNQRPQAIAATGFPQPARAPRRAADRMDPAAMPRSSKAVRKAVRHALGDAEDCTMNDRT